MDLASGGARAPCTALSRDAREAHGLPTSPSLGTYPVQELAGDRALGAGSGLLLLLVDELATWGGKGAGSRVSIGRPSSRGGVYASHSRCRSASPIVSSYLDDAPGVLTILWRLLLVW